MRVGIVGAGPTGSLLAAHLLKANHPDLDIVLVDHNDEIGHGVAFSTDNSQHLLNVRASNMSAFEDDPSHFLRWLWARDSAETNFTGTPPSGQAFVSRHIYGDYVEAVLKAAIAAARPDNNVTVIRQTVVDLHTGERPVLTLGDGRTLYCDRVVLCLGNFPPARPSMIDAEAARSPRYIADPWDFTALCRIPPEDSVLILGSALTMVDAVITLNRKARQGAISVISRRGLTPLPHKQVRPYRALPDLAPFTSSASALLRAVRRDTVRAGAAGYDWRSVLDAVRGRVVALWQAMPIVEKRRFLRHLRPYWDTHRHRLAPDVAAELEKLRAAGALRIQAARIHAITQGAENFDVHFTPRGEAESQHATFSWVINCSGPQCDYDNIPNALVRQALQRGVARPDALKLGLDVDSDGRVVDAAGRAAPCLFALGPPTRGTFLESTAIPDIRQACARVAVLLLAQRA